ncbi:MAG: hypothetical protein JNL85_01590 [Rubrivivax sp.]|nr:hypothetical protein [Rubrivivax sp.]
MTQPSHRGATPGRQRRASALTAALLGAAALLAGCGPLQRLTLRDKDSNDAAVLLSLRPAAWARSGAAGPGRGFEAGYQQYRASGDQVLAAGEWLSAGPQLITGPDVLLQKAKVAAWHVGFTDRFYFGPAFELDVGVGGMKLDVDYELRPQSGVTGTQPFGRSNTLPYGAITPRWRFGAKVALEARLAAAANARAAHDRQDVALVLSPLPQLALRLGWSWRRTSVESWSDPVFDNVDLDIRARGPAVSLRLEF